jgi:hypothetical protein
MLLSVEGVVHQATVRSRTIRIEVSSVAQSSHQMSQTFRCRDTPFSLSPLLHAVNHWLFRHDQRRVEGGQAQREGAMSDGMTRLGQQVAR